MPEIKYNLDVIDKAIADLSILAASSDSGSGPIGIHKLASTILGQPMILGGGNSAVSSQLSGIESSLAQAQSSFSSLVAATRDALAKTRAAISTTDSNLGNSY